MVVLDEDEWPGRRAGQRYQRDDPILHIELRRWAEVFMIAPLDANTLAKLANGLADNCLTCVWRAWDPNRPAILAPAMNTLMWEHPLTARHLRQLAADAGAGPAPSAVDLEALVSWINAACPQLRIVPPQSKRLACGDVGVGAMAELADLVTVLNETLRTTLNTPRRGGNSHGRGQECPSASPAGAGASGPIGRRSGSGYRCAAGHDDHHPCSGGRLQRCPSLCGGRRSAELAGQMRAGRVVLGGERGGLPLPGFDVGNSPHEYTAKLCRGDTLVLTTSNGTRAILRAAEAERTILAGFVNYSAVCEQLRRNARPIHIVCAGTEGEVTLEDTLLAGALVDYLSEAIPVRLNDSARLAWDCFEQHGQVLLGALEVSTGGAKLRALGYDDDIRAAAQVDQFNLVPELRRPPLRVEVGSVGIVQSHWSR